MRPIHNAVCAAAVLSAASLAAVSAQAPRPAAWWTFDRIDAGHVADAAGGPADLVSGQYSTPPGVAGRALKLDGYTTVVTRQAASAPAIDDALTIEAWVALATYPWNWTPVVDDADAETHGYALEIGPRGQLRLSVAVNGLWLAATSADFALPLRTWTHVAARYAGVHGATVFANGKVVGETVPEPSAASRGRAPSWRVTPASGVDLLVGGVRAPERASNWHRFEGTRPSWFSLDGLLDDVKIFAAALDSSAIAADASAPGTPGTPPIESRVFPSGPKGPGRFGAYYATLPYYPEWDALWRVGPDADIVVRFDESPARVVFWRGTQYSPAWVTENNLWMADQSVEGYNAQYTYEHMNDKQNRYSRVDVVEQTEARVVVRWRYALVNVDDEFWNVTARLENGAWIDEYYYLYPDTAGVRKVTWTHGTLGRPIQYQESIALVQPGQVPGDVVDRDYATVGNLQGQTQVLSHVKANDSQANDIVNPSAEAQRKTFPPDLTIQMHQFKSRYKPFAAFEPGSRMLPEFLRDLDEAALTRPARNGHWPVGQVYSDGRTSQAADRAGHFLSFPITDPLIHQGSDGRDYWNGLYGMSDRPFDDVVGLARSWSTPPEVTIRGVGYANAHYDRSERAYYVDRNASPSSSPLTATLSGSTASPIRNVALVVRNWGDADPRLTIDGTAVPRGSRFRYGHRRTLDGSDLILWIEIQQNRQVMLQIR
jgi:hypothetical protein